MRKIGTKRKLALALAILAIAFIWFQSTLPRSVSANESSWFLTNIIQPIMQFFQLGALSHNTVRKLAHVTEFAGLSFLISLVLYKVPMRTPKTILIGFIVAFLDESIQLLSERGSMVIDVWIDLIGVTIGAIAGAIVTILYRKFITRHSETTSGL